jgi:broad specificity phosphatase PhoE
MKLILVRHGAVEGLDPPRFRGRKDLPLTDVGRRQAQATAEFIAATWVVDALVSSPLTRCVDTAAAIAAATGVAPASSDLLIDFDYGEWAWKTHAEVKEGWPDLYELWFAMPQLVRVPGGESLHDLFGRAAESLRMLLLAHRDRTVVAVAHDTVNRALLTQLLDMPLSGYWRIHQDPCCINLVDIGARVEVQVINSTTHLAQLPKF